FPLRKASRRSLDEKLGANPRDVQADSPQVLASDKIERLVVRIAKCEIGKTKTFGSANEAQTLALRRSDPHATRGRRVNVPLAVHFHPVRAPETFLAGQIDQHATVFHRTVGLNVIGENFPLVRSRSAIGYVKNFFV